MVKGKQNYKNKGLEGVCYQINNDNFYVLNEKQPREVIQLSKKGKFISSIKLNFKGDVSGIYFEGKTGFFWVISDESSTIFKMDAYGKVLNKYKIPFHKGEGIAIYKDTIFVVNDATSKLYLFKKP